MERRLSKIRFRKSSTSQSFVGLCAHVTVVGKGSWEGISSGSKPIMGAGTHNTLYAWLYGIYTGHTGHTDHTDKPHSQSDPPTHTQDHATTPEPTEPAADSEEAAPCEVRTRPCPGTMVPVHTGKTRYVILSPGQVQLLSSSTGRVRRETDSTTYSGDLAWSCA